MPLQGSGAGGIPGSSGGGPVLPSPSITSLTTGGSSSRSGLCCAGCHCRNCSSKRCPWSRHLLYVWSGRLRPHLTDASSLGGGCLLFQHFSSSCTCANQQFVELRWRSSVHWRRQWGVPWWRVEGRCSTCG